MSKQQNDPRSRKIGRSRSNKDPREGKKEFSTIAKETIQKSDIVLEIFNAQFIKETRNPDFEKRIKQRGKRLIYIFNKADLTKKETIQKYSYLKPYVTVSCKEERGIKALRDLIKREAKKIGKERVIVGAIGYPNTGKSSIINALSGRGAAKTSAEAGYTKGNQKIKLNDGIYLMDSPGVISKSAYSGSAGEKIAQHTKVGSRSYSQIKNAEMVLTKLMRDYSYELESHYNVEAEGDTEELIEQVAKSKGFMKPGGQPDEERTAKFIIKEWQEGRIPLE
ncbi:MAG: GTPase [Candidatus Paceibacteria bacterium]